LKKEDIRITRTYKLLCNALVKLLNDKPFGKITVTDICREAMINRSTFYDHFEDKYHLLTFGIQDMLEEATATPASRGDLDGIWLNLLRNVADLKVFYRRVLLDGDDESLRIIFHERVAQDLEKHIMEIGDPDLPYTKVVIISEFITGSIVSILRWWLRTDRVTAEELADVIPSLMEGYGKYFLRNGSDM